MESDEQKDIEELRRAADENHQTVERLRAQLRTLKAKLEKSHAGNEAGEKPAQGWIKRSRIPDWSLIRSPLQWTHGSSICTVGCPTFSPEHEKWVMS